MNQAKPLIPDLFHYQQTIPPLQIYTHNVLISYTFYFLMLVIEIVEDLIVCEVGMSLCRFILTLISFHFLLCMSPACTQAGRQDTPIQP